MKEESVGDSVDPTRTDSCALRDWSQFIADWNPDVHKPVHIHFAPDSGFYAEHGGIVLRSAFQPIFSPEDSRPVGHEALLRASDGAGHSISPETVFARTEELDAAVLLDRVCRMLHVMNFARQNPGEAKLYLNMGSRNLMAVHSGNHGSFFRPLLQMCRVHADAIVLEITESRISDHDRLVEAAASYTKQGFKIAIDDFGARDSNFDRLWMLSPHVVKMDRTLIVKADQDARVRRMLPKLVEIVHELEAEVIFEGIETQAQQAIAREAGTDMVQGFLRARPCATIVKSAVAPMAAASSSLLMYSLAAAQRTQTANLR